MNIKNSKFIKRIQALRRCSKAKWRKDFNLIELNLNNAICENSKKVKTNNEIEEKILNNENIGDCANQFENDENKIGRNKNLKNEQFPSISTCKASICVSQSRYAVIGKTAKSIGYRLVKDNKMWNILWTDSLPGVELYKTMKRFQQINHFPGMMEICRKDLLSRNLNRMLKLFPKDYKIFPKTWIFPADYGDAVNFASNRLKTRTFIIKPDSGAQGRGIWLTNDLKNIVSTERMICQTYINKPLLIDGFKFDLRVYTLITSVDPLRIFVYNEGLARFATSKYVEPTASNNCDLFMHLTNYSVNKRSSQYELCDDDDCGSKRNFSAINSWLRQREHNVQEFWQNIDDIIIKTVLSAWPMLKHNYHACFPAHDKIQACFEILGIDILVDSKLKPYILEVNHSPSFHTNEPVDHQVKIALIHDTLILVGTVLADKKQILREDRKRVKQRLLRAKQNEVNINNNNSNHGYKKSESHDFCGNSNKTSDDNKNAQEPNIRKSNINKNKLSALELQTAWEESHLGDFRRIMPPKDEDKLDYYSQFYALEHQSSIFGETAASKKREEVAKKMRLQLEEKRKKQSAILHGASNRLKFEERRKLRQGVKRVVSEKQRLERFRLQAVWQPDFISGAEERLRGAWMQMRTDLLKNLKIAELVYTQLYRAGVISNTDITFYPDLYRRLESGIELACS